MMRSGSPQSGFIGPKPCTLAAGLILFGVASAPTAKAQQEFSLPAVPAFTYLGATPATIARPSTPKDFAIAIADGIDSLGRVQRGLAVDVMPWLMLPVRVTNRSYRTSRASFIYANSQFSLGSVRASGDTTATDMAIGLKTNFANFADPLLDPALGTLIENAVAVCQKLKNADGRPVPAMIEDCSDKAAGKLIESWLNDEGHWNDFALSAAGAFGARLAQSDFTRFRGRGGALWITMAIPLGKSFGQFLIQTREDWVRAHGSAEDTLSFSGGARVAFGSATLNGFGEWVGARRNLGDNKSTDRWSAGIEYRVAENLWISTGFGSAYNDVVKADRAVILANLRWNVAGKPQFVTPSP